MYGYSQIQGTRSKKDGELRDKSVLYFQQESGPCPLDWRITIHSNVDLVFFQRSWPIWFCWKIAGTTFQCMVVLQSMGIFFYSCWNFMKLGSQSRTYRTQICLRILTFWPTFYFMPDLTPFPPPDTLSSTTRQFFLLLISVGTAATWFIFRKEEWSWIIQALYLYHNVLDINNLLFRIFWV